MSSKITNLMSIDAGLKGGLTIWSGDELFHIVKMPIIKKNMVDLQTIASLVSNYNITHIALEEQFIKTTKTKDGKITIQKGSKTNLKNYGALHLFFETFLNLPTAIINPNKWKPFFNLHNRGRSPLLKKITKDESVNKANNMFNLTLKKSQDGLAESALIGFYALKTNPFK